MEKITTIGLDLAKFQVHGIDETDEVVMRKTASARSVLITGIRLWMGTSSSLGSPMMAQVLIHFRAFATCI